MPGTLLSQVQSSRPFLRIVGGNIVTKVDESTPHATLRKWVTPKGEKGEAWELVYMDWTGTLLNVEFRKGEYGEQAVFTFDSAILQLNPKSSYFQNLAEKLCAADLSLPMKLHPYDFEADGKKKIGVSVTQGIEKVRSPFYVENKRGNGFPVVDEKKKEDMGADYWPIYFTEVLSFLKKRLMELEFFPQKAAPVVATQSGGQEPMEEMIVEELKIDDLPF